MTEAGKLVITFKKDRTPDEESQYLRKKWHREWMAHRKTKARLAAVQKKSTERKKHLRRLQYIQQIHLHSFYEGRKVGRRMKAMGHEINPQGEDADGQS